MPNEKNLIPNEQRTPSERRENARKAGKASGAARREKKKLKEYAELLLSLPVADMRKYNALARMGIPIEEINNKMLIVAGLLKEAGNGNVPAAKELRSIIGEDQPPDNDSESLKKARELLGGIDSAID